MLWSNKSVKNIKYINVSIGFSRSGGSINTENAAKDIKKETIEKTVPDNLVTEKLKGVKVPKNKPTEKKDNKKSITSNKGKSSDKTSTPTNSSGPGFGSGSIHVDGNFPFMYYLKTVKKRIEDNWALNKKYSNVKSIIYFRIRKDGTISDADIEKKSGDNGFDSIAMRAILSSTPFPPLPEEYREDDLGIHFGFECNIME